MGDDGQPTDGLAAEVIDAGFGMCRVCGATDEPLDIHLVEIDDSFVDNDHTGSVLLCRWCHVAVHAPRPPDQPAGVFYTWSVDADGNPSWSLKD